MSKIQGEFKITKRLQLTETCFDFSIYCPGLRRFRRRGSLSIFYAAKKHLEGQFQFAKLTKKVEQSELFLKLEVRVPSGFRNEKKAMS
jgi:hypothetical protein